MYYYGFDKKFPEGGKLWSAYDDQLIGMLFSKIINKTVTVGTESGRNPLEEGGMVDDMVNNLFDLCLFINKDAPEC